MFDWNDLKPFLAVAQHQSMIAAGKSLGLSQSTVQRRLSELERRIGRALIVRHPAGYRLTADGLSLLPMAQKVARAVAELERYLDDTAREFDGVIRVTCPEPLVLRIVQSKLLDAFHARHPKLRVEFVTSDRYLDLSQGEADVAFRSGDTDDELVGRKIADSLWAIYASPDYVERHGRPATVQDMTQHPLVGFETTFSSHRMLTWLTEVAPAARFAVRNNSVLGLVSAVKSGAGIGPLPTALGDADDGLVRILGPIPELTRSWRILAHPDLRRTPRIAAFFDFIVEQRAALKPIFTG
ncbi:LysR family transcriptional regulator [Bosea sp. LjRoot9]|uniref:LysR family transcriptional regulator n=1 Tax=Bosea sp. LjRoot9 TaxID=3342341 RepID=UPI003ECCAEE9